MEIINNVKDNEDYVQWIEKFVMDVINESGLNCNKIVIDDIEPDKRIFLIVDSEEYDIRTWNFRPAKNDKNGQTCAEMVEYTLFKMVSDEHGSHGEEVDEGRLMIAWKNN